jgi:DNA polymerase-3 subunit delta'
MSYSKETFTKEQPLLAKFFSSAISAKHLGHAYLLYGEPSSPLLESALFIAMSIMCPNGPLACSKCPSCLKFLGENYSDFLLINGKQATIKKEDIAEIEDFASKSSMQAGKKSVYIIHCADNITSEAINALLKTLEEPSGDVVAILTTSNRDRVLPTIQSRTEPLHVFSPDPAEVTKLYQGGENVQEYFLATCLAYSEKEKQEIIDSKDFTSAFEASLNYLKSLGEKSPEATFVLMNQAASELRGNKCYNYFYSVLSVIFSLALTGGDAGPFSEITASLSVYGDKLAKAITVLNQALAKSQANMNFTFQLARVGMIMEGRDQQ